MNAQMSPLEQKHRYELMEVQQKLRQHSLIIRDLEQRERELGVICGTFDAQREEMERAVAAARQRLSASQAATPAPEVAPEAPTAVAEAPATAPATLPGAPSGLDEAPEARIAFEEDGGKRGKNYVRRPN